MKLAPTSRHPPKADDTPIVPTSPELEPQEEKDADAAALPTAADEEAKAACKKKFEKTKALVEHLEENGTKEMVEVAKHQLARRPKPKEVTPTTPLDRLQKLEGILVTHHGKRSRALKAEEKELQDLNYKIQGLVEKKNKKEQEKRANSELFARQTAQVEQVIAQCTTVAAAAGVLQSDPPRMASQVLALQNSPFCEFQHDPQFNAEAKAASDGCAELVDRPRR